MTTFVTREEWGARPRKQGTISIVPHPSVTFHYVGGGWEYPWDHSSCDDKVRGIQADHMDNRDWSDIAYNYLVCPHDYVYEGRGYDRRSSANGYESANYQSFAVCALWGTASADDPLPDGLKRAYRYARQILIRQGGATDEVKGHRDWKETDCPGDQIYAWIKQGIPAPYVPPPVNEDDMPLSDTDLVKIKSIVVDAVRDYALWEVLYGLETEDEKEQAREAYSVARAAGKSVDEAKAAASAVLSSLRDAIKKSQTL
jgi:hypothetical protein